MDDEQDKGTMIHRRRLRNYLLVPGIQVRLGLYILILAAIAASAFSSIIYYNLEYIYSIIIELTDAQEEVLDILESNTLKMSKWLMLVSFIYVVCNFLITVVFTHKMIGPTYAFRRHVQQLQQGDYSSRIRLRPGDAFSELAEDLNSLSDSLEAKENSR